MRQQGRRRKKGRGHDGVAAVQPDRATRELAESLGSSKVFVEMGVWEWLKLMMRMELSEGVC